MSLVELADLAAQKTRSQELNLCSCPTAQDLEGLPLAPIETRNKIIPS